MRVSGGSNRNPIPVPATRAPLGALGGLAAFSGRAGFDLSATAHSSTGRYSPSVLVVDDDDSIRRLCIRILEETGYFAGEAANGKQALNLVRAVHFDVIAVDLSMPEMDGFEFLNVVRKELPGIKLVVMSGFMRGALLTAASRLGAAGPLPSHSTAIRSLLRSLMP